MKIRCKFCAELYCACDLSIAQEIKMKHQELKIPDIFTAEDFKALDAKLYNSDIMSRIAASIANARFKEIASGWTKVYGHKTTDKKDWIYGTEVMTPEESGIQDLYMALVAFPQQLKPKVCAHEPLRMSCSQAYGGIGEELLSGFKPICGKCGAKLRAAKWVEVE